MLKSKKQWEGGYVGAGLGGVTFIRVMGRFCLEFLMVNGAVSIWA